MAAGRNGIALGHLSPALCVGFGAAAKLRRAQKPATSTMFSSFACCDHVLGPGWVVKRKPPCRYPGNLNLRRDGIDGARLLGDLREIAFSLGSACASGSGRPSHVLAALGLDYRQSRSSVRLGFGRYTEVDELRDACQQIARAADGQERFDA